MDGIQPATNHDHEDVPVIPISQSYGILAPRWEIAPHDCVAERDGTEKAVCPWLLPKRVLDLDRTVKDEKPER
jgi:hypothetical protein